MWELDYKESYSVQLLSLVRLFLTPWTTARQASMSITNSQSLPKVMFIESVMPSKHLIRCRPLLLLPSTFPSIRVFNNELALHIRWWKYWSFSFNISPSNEQPGLIPFRMDWLYLLAVQGTLKSLLQHHSSKASILWGSAFFIVQLSHPHTTTGKPIALTRGTFVEKVMSLLFNMLSRLVITFLPRSKRLLISWLQSPSTVILEPQNIKSDTVSTVSPSICHEVMGLDAMILVFWMLGFKPTFSLSSFTFIKRLCSSSSLSAIRVVSSAYLRWLIFLPAILIPACASSSQVPKNWCFWTVMLEKTLESPLDCKEIPSVHPKGNQSWMFIGRTDIEAGTPILLLLDSKSWLISKDPGAGKDWGQEEKGTTENEMVGWHHRLMDMSLGNLQELWWTERPGVLQSMGLQRVGHDWVTELNWTGLLIFLYTKP